jgi:hypothetical protein
MIFFSALKKLESGCAVRREAWPIDEGYLKLLPGMKFVWKIVLVPNPNAGNFIFSVEDLKSTDWEIVTTEFPKVLIRIDEDKSE